MLFKVKSMKKTFFQILFLLICIVCISLVFTLPVQAAGIGKTFSEQFPDPQMASTVASKFGKQPTDEIDSSYTSITTLDLSGMSLTDIQGVEIFTELNSLYLINNQLTTLPNSIGDLSKLETLMVDGNQLTSLPSELGALSQLKVLYVGQNKLTQLPDTIGNMSSLVDLNITNNLIESLPNSFGTLSKLDSFTADLNKLTQLPDTFGNLTSLTYLSIINNQLLSLPESMGSLKKLVNLNVGFNQLSTLPDSIGGLTMLRRLDAYQNKITVVPDSIGSLSNIIEINFNNNLLTLLPDTIGNLKSITVLSVDNNQLIKLPETIGQANKLVQLSVNGNQMENLPDSIVNLAVINELNLTRNKFTVVPPVVMELKSLTLLRLGYNKISEIPETIDQLINMEILSAENNLLTSLPETIGNFPKLKGFVFSDNQITNLPLNMVQQKDLQFFTISNNLLPTDYETKLNERGITFNASLLNYENQDQLILKGNQIYEIRKQSDFDSIIPSQVVQLASGRTLADSHIYIFGSPYDQNQQPVNMTDYIENGKVKKSGSVFMKVSIARTGIYPEVSDHSTTTEAVELKFLASHQLNFNLNGGSGIVPESQTIEFGGVGSPVVSPNRMGYSFTGWNTSSTGAGTPWLPGKTPMVDQDITLYAQWVPTVYPVHFEANGGTGLMNDEPYVYGETKTLFKNIFTRSNYTFKGWSTTPTGPPSYLDESMFTCDSYQGITLYAQWQPIDNPVNSYSVIFNINGGEGKNPQNQVVDVGAFVTEPDTPRRQGYVFTGWNTAADGSGVKWNFKNMPMPNYDVTLYAQWEKHALPQTGGVLTLVMSLCFLTGGGIFFTYGVLKNRKKSINR